MAQALASALDVPAVDLVDLDRAPLRLKGRIVQEGQLLSSADKPARVAFEVRTRSEYFDFRPPWTRIDAVPATGRRGRPRWLISTGCTNGSRRSARARGGVADAALQVQHDPTAVVLGRGTSCPSSRSLLTWDPVVVAKGVVGRAVLRRAVMMESGNSGAQVSSGAGRCAAAASKSRRCTMRSTT